jgi:hypothetical protein
MGSSMQRVDVSTRAVDASKRRIDGRIRRIDESNRCVDESRRRIDESKRRVDEANGASAPSKRTFETRCASSRAPVGAMHAPSAHIGALIFALVGRKRGAS